MLSSHWRSSDYCTGVSSILGDGDGPFVHLFKEDAIRFLRPFEREDLFALVGGDKDGVDLAALDGLQGLLAFCESRLKVLVCLA